MGFSIEVASVAWNVPSKPRAPVFMTVFMASRKSHPPGRGVRRASGNVSLRAAKLLPA